MNSEATSQTYAWILGWKSLAWAIQRRVSCHILNRRKENEEREREFHDEDWRWWKRKREFRWKIEKMIKEEELTESKLRCAQGLNLWRNNSREVNDVIFKGYWKGKSRGGKQLRLMQRAIFWTRIGTSSTYNEGSNDGPSSLLRVPGLVNLVRRNEYES